jgi:hypothetical protein
VATWHWRGVRAACVFVGVAWLAGASARGQTSFYIVPDRPEAGVGEPFVITGERPGGTGAPWPAEWLTWMFVRGGGGQRNYEPGTPAAEAGKAGPVITLEGFDAGMVGVELAPRDEAMDGKALAAWARENLSAKTLPEGLEALEGAGPVVVRRVESAKALIRTRGEGELRRENRPTRSATATDKAGQAVEIRPLFDPTAQPVPCDITLRMYAQGEGAKRAQLRVVHVASGEEQRVIADEKAIALVHLERPGAYRVEFHALVKYVPPDAPAGTRAPPASNAAWALHTATLTFTVPDLAKEGPAPAPAKEQEKPR